MSVPSVAPSGMSGGLGGADQGAIQVGLEVSGCFDLSGTQLELFCDFLDAVAGPQEPCDVTRRKAVAINTRLTRLDSRVHPHEFTRAPQRRKAVLSELDPS